MDEDWTDAFRGSRRRVMGMAVGVEGGMAVLAIALGLLLGLPVGAWVVWSDRGFMWGLAGAAVMLGLLFAARAIPLGPVARLSRLMDGIVKSLFGECRWWELLLVSVLAGIGEELLFRGVIQGGLDVLLGGWMADGPNWIPTAVAIAIASIVFGFAHCLSRAYVVFAILVGVLLGWMAIATGDLLAPIVAHAAYDFVALMLLRGDREAPLIDADGR